MKNHHTLVNLLRSMLILAGLLAITGGAIAAPLPINNNSFESANYSGANSWTNNLTDANPVTTIEWEGRDGNGDGDAFIERIGGFFSEGVAHIGLQVGYYVYQNTTVPWQANTRYTLTVGIGNRNATFSTSANQTVFGLTNVSPNVGTYPNTASLIAGDPVFNAASRSIPILTVAPTASTYVNQSLVYDTGPVPPPGTVVVVIADNSGSGRSHFDNVRLDTVSTLDPDSDGLPTDWEVANGLDPNIGTGVNGAGGDFDTDGSTNAQEFARGTKANDNDTDDDGALDGAETKTGIYVSASDTGTDPLKSDTDGDTLPDGAEGGAAKPTNPNLADTDGDQFEDQAEIAAGTNPSAGGQASFPTSSASLSLGLNFIGGRVDGTPGASVTGSAGLVPQSNWNNLPNLSGSGVALVNASGSSVIMRANWVVDDTYTVDFSVPADANSALMQGYLKTRNGVPTQVVVRNISIPAYDVFIYCDSEAFDRVSTYTANGAVRAGVMDVQNWPIGTGGGTFVEVTADNTAGNVVVFRNVSGPTLTITAANTGPDFGAPINAVQIVSSVDSDGDGMPNAWESANGLNPAVNDAAGDADSDGSTNLTEFQRQTNPQDNDTDNDTLLDGVETGTGTYVSVSNTGTNPLVADTDADGLADNVENNSGNFVSPSNPGTNPNNGDSDSDGFSDGAEASGGSNPLVATSIPPLAVPIGYWPFDDRLATTADISPGNHPGTLTGTFAYVAGSSGAAGDYAIQFNGLDVSVTTGVALLDGLGAYTMSGWVNFNLNQAARTGLWGANDTLEFGMADLDTLAGWTPTGGQLEAGFGPTSAGWKHVAITDDGITKRIYISGVEVASGAAGAPTTSVGAGFNIGGNGIWDATGNWFNGLIDDVAVWNQALGAPYISRLAQRTIKPYVPPGGEIAVTNVTRNPATGAISFTFDSIAGRTYTVHRSDTLNPAGWQVLTNNQAATGGSTTYTDNPGSTARRYVYKATLNP
ncbi:MAG TPA: LamG-like jellyroll fold domain-containing protein [Verrucomicrobiales bacterium]|nr:LamG-like jellyroll fold domain-containing protein [Verrucomicrobiales bacterium]